MHKTGLLQHVSAFDGFRSQHLGAKCFRSLSLVLASLGKLEEALESVKQSIEECLSSCEEAVEILRKVSETETYFLPKLKQALIQLEGYLRDQGKFERAEAVAEELMDVQRKIETAPPEPEFLFYDFRQDKLDYEAEKEEVGSDGEDETAYETATEESGEEYEDATEEIGR
ncbi:hypothetical protein FB45DRAFT_860092 [Roridomyces roridus]|uniref:Uncharacterized protein n=1 Tax=Roridomyces roridus TaxID=1738132 RepID=A0AAD7CFR3_9AGAR|nr:hypothetical protein FB45DRAFT_860092 [Roridomyces roridus]